MTRNDAGMYEHVALISYESAVTSGCGRVRR
jgi:hypothetical protein